ncbi:hypothetical protein LEP1GSC047_0152 [Leptospira inadai serovar Lyme str. 10]|uniref:Uncharacterized protein n=1 Tax=Leptospira inadai serovar Lyme str. 10 TaxID=1049790 RepID=V6HPL6_9LEPT|nr:hypothetical protein LEP1GSC047_0152 [Leptospira inadai serovar Lyme str. 10]
MPSCQGIRGQRTEDRGQRTEDRGQRTEDRGQIIISISLTTIFLKTNYVGARCYWIFDAGVSGG